MNQAERRLYLIQAMVEEMPQYKSTKIPTDEAGQFQLLRALFNVRPPYPVSPELLQIQDAFLSEEVKRRGVVKTSSLQPIKANDRLFLWQGDITTLECDAIVNAANSALLGCFQPCHACIDNVIHTYSGVQLRIKCKEIMQAQGHEEATGTAKITPGYNLPSKYVLHTVGPIISGPLGQKDCDLLASCYQSCLELAAANEVMSIAFCCISTGVFHFPQKEAAKIAIRTVTKFLEGSDAIRQVVFNVYTDKDLAIYRALLER